MACKMNDVFADCVKNLTEYCISKGSNVTSGAGTLYGTFSPSKPYISSTFDEMKVQDGRLFANVAKKNYISKPYLISAKIC